MQRGFVAGVEVLGSVVVGLVDVVEIGARVGDTADVGARSKPIGAAGTGAAGTPGLSGVGLFVVVGMVFMSVLS